MSEGLEDWVLIQKRTFTGWANSYLKIRSLQINEIQDDFQDGQLVIQLLELISSKSLGKYNKGNNLIRAKKLENCQTALHFVKDEGIKLVNIGPEDFVDKKLSLILGFVWTLILRYHIQKGGVSASAKNDLLKWVQSKIPHKNVVDFTNSWKDGTAICELAEALKPGQIDCKNLDPSKALENATLGETSAEKNMDIPMVLAPEDMVAEQQDELSIMTYISYYRDYDRRMNSEKEEALKHTTVVSDKCIAYGPGLEGGQTHQPAPFTIEARNCFDQKVAQGGETFEVVIKTSKNKVLECGIVDNQNGTYSCEYLPIEAGKYHISITHKRRGIHGNPWTPIITRTSPCAKTTKVFGPGIEDGNIAGKPTHFTIQAQDEKGHPVPSGGDPFKVHVHGPFGLVPSQLKDNNDGSYLCEYTPAHVGTHTIDVKLVDDHVAQSTYTIQIERPEDEADPRFCTAFGEGVESQSLKSDFATFFTIAAKNKRGETLSIQANQHYFEVEVSQPDGIVIPVVLTPNSDGTLKAEYTPLRPGGHRVDVQLHDPRDPLYYEHIKDSPFKVLVEASADANTTIAYGPGLEDGVKDTEKTHFTIETKDIDGNPIKKGGEDIGCKILGPNGEDVPAEVEDRGDGTYNVVYQPSGPGKHKITPTVRDKPIQKAPFIVNAKAGTDPKKSYIEGFTFRIRATDKQGQPKKEGGDDFKVVIEGPKGEVPNVKVEDLRDGSYLTSYNLAEPGEYTIHVTLNGDHIAGSPWKQHA